MIAHTMQEIADFFGCYVAKDGDDGSVWGYLRQPFYDENETWNGGALFTLKYDSFPSDAAIHDPRVLVSPRKHKDLAALLLRCKPWIEQELTEYNHISTEDDFSDEIAELESILAEIVVGLIDGHAPEAQGEEP